MSNPWSVNGSGSTSSSYESILKSYQKIDADVANFANSVFGNIDLNEIAKSIKAEKDAAAKKAFLEHLPGMLSSAFNAAVGITSAVTSTQASGASAHVQDLSGKTKEELQTRLDEIPGEIEAKERDITKKGEAITAAQGKKSAADSAAAEALTTQKSRESDLANAKNDITTAKTALLGYNYTNQSDEEVETATASTADGAVSITYKKSDEAQVNAAITKYNEAKEKETKLEGDENTEGSIAQAKKAYKEQTALYEQEKENIVKLGKEKSALQDEVKQLKREQERLNNEIKARDKADAKAQKKQDDADAKAAKAQAKAEAKEQKRRLKLYQKEHPESK